MTHGQLVEVFMEAPGICRCGRPVAAGEKVQLWKSLYGPTHDHLVSCVRCERPTGLVPERMWLMKQRLAMKEHRFPFLYGYAVGPGGVAIPPNMPQELADAWARLEADLDANWRNINTVMMRLLEKLPKCEECSKYATHSIKHGAFLCETHAAAYTTAQKLDWAKELEDLGVTDDV